MTKLIRILLFVLICVASSALVRYVVNPPTRDDEVIRQQNKFQAANDAKFRSLYDAGQQQLRSGDFPAALASFAEAEHSSAQLSDKQYAQLKTSRQQLAQNYESAGRASEAQSVYQALVDSGIQEGRQAMETQHCNAAIPRFQDAEQFAPHLTAGQQDSLHESRSLQVACLSALRRFSEAEETTQRTIDYLRASAQDFDPAFGSAYLELAMTYSQAGDSADEEQALAQASEAYDRTIAHFSGLAGGDVALRSALTSKDYALYGLMITCQHEGKFGRALSTGEDFYKFASEHATPWGELQPYSRKQIATLALQIATVANDSYAIDTWRGRLNSLP